jgi:hypothetical protein
MAEDLLVKESLTPEMISAGQALVRSLEGRNLKLSSAFWLFDPEQAQWRLYLASPEIETRGTRFAYEAASTVVSDALSLEDISFVSPRNEIVNAISKAIHTGGSIVGIRFSRNSINGHFIHDAYIYKS